MNPSFAPPTVQIQEVFGREVAAAGGSVSDTYDDGRRLFLRAVLPSARELRQGDQVQAGVALRTAEQEIRVHPYLFRQVCRNGAIMAQALQTRRLERVEGGEFGSPPDYEVARVLEELGAAVRECCSEEAFADSARRVRSALETEADFLLNVSSSLFQVQGGISGELMAQILDRFSRDGDRSMFGLMNAVTSLARDTQDAELRWRLEELGGGVPALVRPRRVPDGAAALALKD